MKTIIYHNPRCTKSREALVILKQTQTDFEVIEYLKHPPTKEELTFIIQKLGIQPEMLLRRKESLFKEKFIGKQLTNDEWINVMVQNPILIERPIVVKGNRAVIGRPPERVLEIV